MIRLPLLSLVFSTVCLAGQIKVTLPDDIQPQKAQAVAREMKLESPGEIDGKNVTFDQLLPQTAYDLRLELKNGRVLQGVDMGWYGPEAPAEKPEEMTDDDREEIRAIVQDVPGFYNKSDILMTRGDHDRATVLVQLIRDKAFHSDAGGEIIWHIELWYFQNQHGGWEKVPQQNKVLRRERFTSRAAFDADAGKIQWSEALGGLKLEKKEEKKEIILPASVFSEHKGTGREPRP